MLTNSLKIPDNTKTEFLELILFQIDQKICQKYRHCRFKQFFGAFHMLTAHKCSDAGF